MASLRKRERGPEAAMAGPAIDRAGTPPPTKRPRPTSAVGPMSLTHAPAADSRRRAASLPPEAAAPAAKRPALGGTLTPPGTSTEVTMDSGDEGSPPPWSPVRAVVPFTSPDAFAASVAARLRAEAGLHARFQAPAPAGDGDDDGGSEGGLDADGGAASPDSRAAADAGGNDDDSMSVG